MRRPDGCRRSRALAAPAVLAVDVQRGEFESSGCHGASAFVGIVGLLAAGLWVGVVGAGDGEGGGGGGVGEGAGGGSLGASAEPGEGLADVVDGDEGEGAGVGGSDAAGVFVTGGVEPVADGAVWVTIPPLGGHLDIGGVHVQQEAAEGSSVEVSAGVPA